MFHTNAADAGAGPEPARRQGRLSNDELKSPIRPVDYLALVRVYRHVAADHLVQAGAEWA